MKTSPIIGAGIDVADPAAPRRMLHELEQARATFLAGNGLPARWRAQRRFTIVETGFGLGVNFLATWAAWRDDPARCERLHFVSLQTHPLTRADFARAHARSPLQTLADALLAQWPPHTPNLHLLDFESQRVRLVLGYGDTTALVRELVVEADAFYLDAPAPAHRAEPGLARLCAGLARLAAPGATAACASSAPAMRDALAAAGFSVQAAPGPANQPGITLAHYAPRFVPPRAPGRRVPLLAPTHAVVVGAGLAGAAAARALVRAGVECTVLDRAAQPASQASGNPGGLFHSTIGRADGPHHRLHRAASFLAARWVRETQHAPGGLLRAGMPWQAMRAIVEAQRLPADHVQALDARAASALAGMAVAAAWHYVEGGWADPAALVRETLGAAGIRFRPGADVQRIQPRPGGWCVLDRCDRVLAEAPLLVLAAAHEALPLAGLPSQWSTRARGQVSWVEAADLLRPPPRVPVASGGYALALADGRLLIGASQDLADDEPRLRDADHGHNLVRAAALLGAAPLVREGAQLQGRVGWRAVTRDRLPIVGAAPDLATAAGRSGAPRFVPRQAGLYLLCGLGSRGLTTAALCGELIAAQATGAPWPLEADLADAIDPARFVARP